jgi:hypothetical protein
VRSAQSNGTEQFQRRRLGLPAVRSATVQVINKKCITVMKKKQIPQSNGTEQFQRRRLRKKGDINNKQQKEQVVAVLIYIVKYDLF